MGNTIGWPKAPWANRLMLDEQDHHILLDYRLEYKQSTKGYWKVLAVKRGNEGRKQGYISLARLIMQPRHGLQVDHIDRDTLNNKRGNLRVCTASQNQANTFRTLSESGFRGVKTVRSKWHAFIQHRRIGSFENPEDAARAYDREARRIFGEFATVNFPFEPSGRPGQADDLRNGGVGHFNHFNHFEHEREVR